MSWLEEYNKQVKSTWEDFKKECRKDLTDGAVYVIIDTSSQGDKQYEVQF